MAALTIGSLEVPTASAAAFTSHTFTSCGKTGQTGPSLAQCVSAYSSTDWAADGTTFDVTGGIQYWRVPVTGTYRLTVAGAQGGGSDGAPGALIAQHYPLTAGTILKILVGQRGVSVPGGPIGGLAGGGGGGSFVAVADADDTPVIVAGGGGGGFDGHTDLVWPSAPGSTSSCGSAPPASYASGSGGCAGAGGTTTTSYNGSGAGGGYYSNGATNPRSGGGGGQAFVAGGTGGTGAPSGIGAPGGGFGGGGGGSISYFVRGGGGGGYSGGAGAYGAGGGGGLYFSPLSTNQAVLGTNTGNGSVEIARLTPLAPIVTGTSGLTNSDSASWEFSIPSADSYLCRIDSDPYVECTSPFAVSGVDEGDHTFSVIGASSDGQGPASEVNWTVDTTAPSAPELTGTLTNSTSASITLSGEEGATFGCSLDDEPFSGCASPWTASGLAEGEHALSVRQTDRAGNQSLAVRVTWTIAALTIAANPTLSADGDAPLGVGTTVSGSGQSFSGSPGAASETFRWQRCSSSITNWCSSIASATAASYTVTAADVGKRLRLTVTHTTTDGRSITARSATTGIVVPTPGGSSAILLPEGASGPVYGRSLKAVGPPWSGGLPPGMALLYRWQRCPASAGPGNTAGCASILSSTGSTYTPQGADVGRRLRLLVGVSASSTYVWAASPVSSIVSVRPVNDSEPTINLPAGASAPRRWMRVQASQGTWSYLHGGRFTWKWALCTSTDPTTCVDLAGHNSSLFIPATAHIGKRLRVTLTYRSPDGYLTSGSSGISATITR